jgi:predicted MPP superfamily phosphohydrolase
VLTGDYITQPYSHRNDRYAARDAEPCAELLARMTSRLGTYAVLGNHDANTAPEHVTAALEATPIKVLHNRSIAIEQQGARLWLAGLADVLGRKVDSDVAFRGIPVDEPTILLVHEPDYADFVPAGRVDLQLSGHSHGGQIVLPLMGPPYLPQLAQRYWRGIYKVGGMTLYTNRGLGTIWLPMRLNAPPEVTLLTLKTLNYQVLINTRGKQ